MRVGGVTVQLRGDDPHEARRVYEPALYEDTLGLPIIDKSGPLYEVRDLPPEIGDAVRDHMAARPEYANAADASGNCAWSTTQLRWALIDRGWSVTAVNFVGRPVGPWERDIHSYDSLCHDWYLASEIPYLGHIAARIDLWRPICIDLTARQFTQDAPWPLIFDLPERNP